MLNKRLEHAQKDLEKMEYKAEDRRKKHQLEITNVKKAALEYQVAEFNQHTSVLVDRF